ncbi:long-chain fatty acid--CoA ligase [Arthrobacter sp. PAMC25564]|uniref:long-chain-fatty-acid--CoA ligase n=1 Tax=Arthrobacter sp. PAMC25564 TaxID=2565366 RepID=UPI0010A29742|nr:long-chain fatty acid--CoA ligase [Arthrobacter sp. PAMC25564]QCB97953.1 long-chain fatty acid--CoA ligase [Arthrobacter sp. PAMC25564]
MLNLSMLLEDSARSFPDRDAVAFGDQRLTYAELESLANQVAHLLLARGIQPGDRVALTCPNVPWFPVIYNGILKAGGVVVPLNVLLRTREVRYHLEDSGARVYFCFDGSDQLPTGETGREAFGATSTCESFFAIPSGPEGATSLGGVETVAQAIAGRSNTFEPVATKPDDTAVILYSSGTTGQPKGAEVTHSNMVLNALAANRLCGSSPDRPDRFLVTLPLFHSFGQTMTQNAGFATGSTLVMLPRFEPKRVLALMEREEITFFSGVPTMYWSLLNSVTDDVDVERIAKNLRLALSGGSPLPVDVLHRFEKRFGIHVLEGYGLSETSPSVLSEPPGSEPRPGSVGLPIWGIEVRLIDYDWNTLDGADVVGEIAVRGHNVMKGYFGRPEATAEVMKDGWLRTGDLAKRDQDGWYYIVDRAKDMVIRGGYNVYPREIEEVLLTNPEVSLAAVIGVPHEVHGEEVKAFVILKEGSTLTAEELRSWSEIQMAAYKYPRVIEIVTSLPMTATGKILKRQLTAESGASDRPVFEERTNQ